MVFNQRLPPCNEDDLREIAKSVRDYLCADPQCSQLNFPYEKYIPHGTEIAFYLRGAEDSVFCSVRCVGKSLDSRGYNLNVTQGKAFKTPVSQGELEFKISLLRRTQIIYSEPTNAPKNRGPALLGPGRTAEDIRRSLGNS